LDLPFICNSAVQATKVIYDLYDKYFAPDFNDYKVLWLYSAGPGQFHSTTKPITRLEDLQGAKMRSPSAYMSKALQLIGSNAVGMPISELTVSLQKGVIDGMLTPFSALADFRLYDLVKFITEVDFYVSPMAVVMNKEKFGSLPDFAKKAIMTAAGKEWGLHAAKVYDDHDQDTAKEGSSKYKIKIIKVSDSELKRFKEKVKIMETDWINQTSQKGIPAKEIMDAIYSSAARNK
jgi:TRAP-type C4-dicarboxylate transport system substrate-binding protein